MMTRRYPSDDSPALAFLVGETFTAPGLVLVRKPAKSAAAIIDGAIRFDTPGLYRFKRADAATYYEAVAFHADAPALLYSHTSHPAAANGQRNTRAALGSLILDPRATEAAIAATIEADAPAHIVPPGVHAGTPKVPPHGQPGALLPFQF